MVRKLKNVTVTLDPEVARWARVEAARRDVSVSRLLGAMLEERMAADDAYALAHARYLTQKPGVHRASGQRLPSREDLHDRHGLR